MMMPTSRKVENCDQNRNLILVRERNHLLKRHLNQIKIFVSIFYLSVMTALTRSAKKFLPPPNEQYTQHLCVNKKTSTRKFGVKAKSCTISHAGKFRIERVNSGC